MYLLLCMHLGTTCASTVLVCNKLHVLHCIQQPPVLQATGKGVVHVVAATCHVHHTFACLLSGRVQ
jgi:hypothetical protein